MSDYLKTLRLERGFSIEQLGRLTGLSARTILRLEKGENEPSLETLVRLRKALKLRPSTVLLMGPPPEGDADETEAEVGAESAA